MCGIILHAALDPQIAPILIAIGVSAPAIIMAVSAYKIAQRLPDSVAERVAQTVLPPIAEIKHEVTPDNGLTLGATADKIYSHQIASIPKDERVPQEEEHMAAMAANDPVVAEEQVAAEAKVEEDPNGQA